MMIRGVIVIRDIRLPGSGMVCTVLYIHTEYSLFGLPTPLPHLLPCPLRNKSELACARNEIYIS